MKTLSRITCTALAILSISFSTFAVGDGPSNAEYDIFDSGTIGLDGLKVFSCSFTATGNDKEILEGLEFKSNIIATDKKDALARFVNKNAMHVGGIDYDTTGKIMVMVRSEKPRQVLQSWAKSVDCEIE